MGWDFQLLVLKIGNVLAQIHELKCMQKHINKGGWNGSNYHGLHHFLLIVLPRISPQSIHQTSSRTMDSQS